MQLRTTQHTHASSSLSPGLFKSRKANNMVNAPGKVLARPRHYYVDGFGSLASLMVDDDDHKPAVYKCFQKLSTRDILYYQSELCHLQQLQDSFDIQDSIDQETDARLDAEEHREWIRRCAQSWTAFEEAASHPNPAARGSVTRERPDEIWKQRMELAVRIRRALKAYREALMQESALLSLQPPSKQTMEAMSGHFHPTPKRRSAPARGMQPADYSMLSGAGSSLYPPPEASTSGGARIHDYVSLAKQDEPDLLTYLLRTYLSRLFESPAPSTLSQYEAKSREDTISHRSPHQVRHYSGTRVKFVASFITTLAAAALLFLPIYALYHTSSSRPALTMGLLAMFTVVFAASLAVMTTASRSEIFGACAAYSAVLVVFVSGDFVGGGSNG